LLEGAAVEDFTSVFLKLLLVIAVAITLYFAFGIHNRLFGVTKSSTRKRALKWTPGFDFKIARETEHFALIYNPLYYGGYNQSAVVLDMFEDLYAQGFRFIDSPNGYMMICERIDRRDSRHGKGAGKKAANAA